MKHEKYIKLDEVLALIPEDDIVGPKPSRLREEIKSLKPITLLKIEAEDYPSLSETFEEVKI